MKKLGYLAVLLSAVSLVSLGCGEAKKKDAPKPPPAGDKPAETK